mgnify:CR=1 FL=1
MNARNNRAREIFLEAIEKEAPDQRATFLQAACGGDLALRNRVEQLLRSYEVLGTFHEDDASPGREPTIDTGSIAEGPGTMVGRYKLLEEIGEGGMGVVYMAEQREPVRRKVALKIIKPGMDTREVVARFEAERQALAMMDHPNIANILDGGATSGSGRPYLVMELVKGIPITEFSEEQDRTTPDRQNL